RKTLRVATFGGLTALLLVGAVTRQAWAGAPAAQIKQSIDRAISVLQDPELQGNSKIEERRAAIREIADETFDFEETAKRALAAHWRKRTKREQEEFVQLFADLWGHAGFFKIDEYGGERIVYLEEIVDGDRATVRTKIIMKKGPEVPVDYRMLRRGDRWMVYDVLVEGVSLVRNYRAQLNKIIRTSSYEALVKKLKAKQTKAREQAIAAKR
ncbi:MAG: phospholipid-binding protein MlaC, partial [Candidatus Methylomirabilia bacterium]